GVKTKVLHYLAHGRQVAGTAVAFEGLDGAPGLVEASLPRLPEVIARLVAVPESAAAAERRAALQRTWLERRHGRSRVRAQWAAAGPGCAPPPSWRCACPRRCATRWLAPRRQRRAASRVVRRSEWPRRSWLCSAWSG